MITIDKKEIEEMEKEIEKISDRKSKLRKEIRELTDEEKSLKEKLELSKTIYKYQEELVDDNDNEKDIIDNEDDDSIV